MSTADLQALLKSFVSAAREAPPAGAGDGWPIELQLAHVAANARLIGLSVAEACNGGARSYRNDAVIDERYLEALVAGAGSRERLFDDAERASRELLGLLEAYGERLDRPLHVRIREGEQVPVDEDWTARRLLESNFTVHLRLHARQLRERR